MKKLYIFVSLLFSALFLWAQPQLMNYQGVARDRSGKVAGNQNISLQIHIIAGEVYESPVYSEIHKITTSQFGVFNVHIGAGNPVHGTFADIEWGHGNHYVKVEMDSKGGRSFKDLGTTQLLSVPYAFHAQTAGSVLEEDGSGELKSAKPGVKAQTWSLFGNRATDPQTDRLGTTDDADLVLITNNEEAMRILSNGNIKITNSLDIGGNLRVRGDSVLIDHNLYVGDTTHTRGLYVKDKVADEGEGGYIATFENTDEGKGDGIAIKLGREETNAENNFITFYRQNEVAGRIEGYCHKLGETPAVVTDIIEPMLDDGSDLYKVLGFNPPLKIDMQFIKLTGGNLPYLDIWFGPPPGYKWNKGSFPSLEFSSPIQFTDGSGFNVNNFIQPWKWFSPDWSALLANPQESDNPMFALISEAQENDWKTLVDMGITELAIKTASMELEAIAKSGGITYGSKGADYAEWLPMMDEEENLSVGQVVGVYGGKIALKTDAADQILVVSSKPVVLGNMPDEENIDRYEKVAFLGQVPTWVRGHVKVGDYILASGKNDGTGVAVSPDELQLEDMDRIIGKAWSESNNLLLSLINVAIGLNRNDLSKIALSQQNKISDLEARMQKMEEKLNSLNGPVYTENQE